MKTIKQNLQALFSNYGLVRVGQKLAIILQIGMITAAFIVTSVSVQPGRTVAPGGCTAPEGECSTSTEL